MKTVTEELGYNGFNIQQVTKMGVNFSKNTMKGSIFNTGVTVIEKVSLREDALKLFNEINL